MNKAEISKKAISILKKEKKDHDHIRLCNEAGICPECGNELQSMVVVRFWKGDLINTVCSENKGNYDELELADSLDY